MGKQSLMPNRKQSLIEFDLMEMHKMWRPEIGALRQFINLGSNETGQRRHVAGC